MCAGFFETSGVCLKVGEVYDMEVRYPRYENEYSNKLMGQVRAR